MLNEFKSNNTQPLNKADIVAAAKTIGCEPAALRAICMVESPNGGFIINPSSLYNEFPIILFESHKFSGLTGGIYNNSHPDISTSTWVHNYGPSGGHQWDRINSAIALNREAALKSASWGDYQLMGFNYYNAGYDNVEELVKGMVESEANQLDTLICFLQNTNIDRYLISKSWSDFALHYNGSGQVAMYAGRIKDEYNKLVAAGYNQ